MLASPAPSSEPPVEQVVRTDRFGDPLPPRALARLGTVRFRQSWSTMSVAYSPDGKTLVIGGAGQGLGLWDAATGKSIRQFAAPDRAFHRVTVFSPDGKLLAATGGRGELWEVATGKKVRDLAGGEVAFAPDGTRVALVVNRQTIRLEETVSGEAVRAFKGHTASVLCLAFSPDGRRLASAGADRTVRLWDVATGKEIHRWTAHTKAVSAVAFSADGRLLASGGEDETVRLWDPVGGKELRRLDGGAWVRALTFAPHGPLLAAACGSTLRLFDTDGGKEVRSWKAGVLVFSPAFSPDGKTLVCTQASACDVRRFDLATGEELPDFGGHRGPVRSLAFADDGKTLSSAGYDRTVRSWDLATTRDTVVFDRSTEYGSLFHLSPGRAFLVISGVPGERFAVWDVVRQKRLYQEKGQNPVFTLAFSADGRTLAEAEEGTVRLRRFPSGEEIGTCVAAPNVETLAFSPDGRTLAAGLYPFGEAADRGERSLRLWDVATRKERPALPFQGRVECVAFAPDGRLLASGDGLQTEHRVRLWDLASGRQLWSAAGHPDAVLALAFSADGRLLVSGSVCHGRVGALHLWETISGREVTCLEGHMNAVRSLAFSPDGRVLASGGADSQILLWDLTGRRTQGRDASPKLSAAQLEQSWNVLAGADAGAAYDTIWLLAAAPELAVAFLKARLRPDEAPDPKRVARLLADLDDADFKVRSAAHAELCEFGDAVEPLLRERLETRTSLEFHRRLEQILQTIAASRQRLRTVRAIQALEYAGSPDARRLLEGLARGLPGTTQTREAQATLQRLRAKDVRGGHGPDRDAISR